MKIIDRYILKKIVQSLIFSALALSVIFILVDLMENLDDFLDRNAPIDAILKYYANFLPETFKILSPVAFLISVLFSIGKMSNDNETTSLKSSGASLYRIMAPVVVFSVFLSFGQLYFNGWITPRANAKKIEIEEKYLKKRIADAPIYNLYFRDSPLRNVSMRYYDAEIKTGNEISIQEFSSVVSPRLSKVIEARKIVWDSTKSKWKMYAGVERIFSNGKIVFKSFKEKYADINLTHRKILALKKKPEEMTFDELRNYIELLKRGGKDVRKRMIEYYGEIAFPFAHFIIALFAVPFASIKRKDGMAIQASAALGLTFAYLVFTKIFQTIGYAADLSPILSGWGANAAFFLVGILTIAKTRT